MAADLELLSAADKAALLAISRPELLSQCQSVLVEKGYKVHTAGEREEFLSRFAQFQYEVVMIEDCFNCASSFENSTLQAVQSMPMNQRRHAVTLLIGKAFQTLQPMQAFQQSVHAVVNPADLGRLAQIVQKVCAEAKLFLAVYRETQAKLTQS